MGYFLRILSLALVVGCATLFAPHAQESTAGGTLQTEASWSALKSLIDSANNRISLLDVDIGAAKNCAKQTKIWDPARGCVNIDTTYYDKVVACADLGQLYDKGTNKCVAITADKKGCTWSEAAQCPYSSCKIRTRTSSNAVMWINVPTKWNDGDFYAYTKAGEDNYYSAQCRDGKFVEFYTGT